MEEQKYGDWSLEIHERLSGKRVPIGGSLELTQRCNNKCVHCYNNLAASSYDLRQGSFKEGWEEHLLALRQK